MLLMPSIVEALRHDSSLSKGPGQQAALLPRGRPLCWQAWQGGFAGRHRLTSSTHAAAQSTTTCNTRQARLSL